MSNTKTAPKTAKTAPKATAKPEVTKAATAKTAVAKTEPVAAAITLNKVENPGKQAKVLDEKMELKAETKIKMLQANPKRPSSKIYGAYEKYKSAKTIEEYAEKFGKGWQAGVKYDYQHGFLTIV